VTYPDKTFGAVTSSLMMRHLPENVQVDLPAMLWEPGFEGSQQLDKHFLTIGFVQAMKSTH